MRQAGADDEGMVFAGKSSGRARHARGGFTLSETLVTAVVAALVIGVLALAMDGLRNELKRQQADELLRTLERAMAAYHEATRAWPTDSGATGRGVPEVVDSGDEPRPSPPGALGDPLRLPTPADAATDAATEATAERSSEPQVGPGRAGDGSADRIVALLQQVVASRAVLEEVPAILWAKRDDGTASQPGHGGATLQPAAEGGAENHIQDPWGTTLVCITATSPSATHRKAVAANGGRPIFIIAGPDRQFGFADVAAASDNLRSDELGR